MTVGANSPDCLHADSALGKRSSHDWVSRAYIDELERQEEVLKSRPRPEPPITSNNAGLSVFGASPPNTSPNNVQSVLSINSSSTVARGSGLSFISLLFTDADWRRTNADLLRSLARTPRGQDRPVDACSLPSSSVVKSLFERYLDWSQLLQPFVIRQELWDLYSRVFTDQGEQRAATAPHDLFRTFILCAIASVIPYRNGLHPQHPEGYYHAALQHMGPDFLTRGLESIQDLLMICRFGVYHYIGTSIWDLTQICGRLCTEQGLHCGDGETGDLLHDQRRRRVFWSFYLIDRYCSSTLDRPFAIDDRSIEVGFPADADDVELIATNTSFDSLDTFQAARSLPTAPTEMTIFLYCVQLRQVSSRIHVECSKMRQDPTLGAQPHLAVGRISSNLNRLLEDLASWRSGAPHIPSPRCLFETQEWTSLVRRAMDLVPKTDGPPPKHILSLFLRTALDTIHCYASISQRKTHIIHTRNYFHMIFTAGLSLLYCTSLSLNLTQGDLLDLSRGLELPDAYSYVALFEALHHHVSRKIQRALGNNALGFAGQEQQQSYQHSHVPHEQYAVQQPALTTDATSIGLGLYQQPPVHVGDVQLTAEAAPVTYAPGGQQDWGGPAAATAAPVFGTSSLGLFGGGEDMASDQRANNNIGQDLRTNGENDPLQWAFMNDESIWNMDIMLGEYVYGDPTSSGLLDSVLF
ncbi:hypothetical protein F5X68DRAFT_268272 [Plectosphaerella plurivora]|uniref:Xylanolytic transcriptional activator regulatory domain-containing protein n=1 Tax=Plectosphaerella plurivora TaxID=936078 RepID=A0A9P9ADW6_9PEZI|nr:hypothetical protein F5X68DRAFT_268272 [Plectosphaerella plurivora]